MFNGLKVKIMKKKVLFAAMALVALASCSDETFVGDVTSAPQDNSPSESNAIVFASASNGVTRADIYGGEAAKLLGNFFYVMGTKGTEAATSPTPTKVFDNYLVQYSANTAGTTTSNTANWEYVGVNPGTAPAGYPKLSSITGAQTIKYWDYSTDQYDFFAFSTGKKTPVVGDPTSTVGTPTTGQIGVTSMNFGTSLAGGGTAYQFNIPDEESLKEVYITDITEVLKANYGKEVQLRFKNLGSKIRIALYETVPGYAVSGVKFYTVDAADVPSDLETAANKTDEATLISTSSIPTSGTIVVSFPHVGVNNSPEATGAGNSEKADYNKASVDVTAGSTSVTFHGFGELTANYSAGENVLSGSNSYLGRTLPTATFAGSAAAQYYTTVFPVSSSSALTLRVDYTLTATDGSGETINIYGAKASVPANYTKWRPNYAYTYIFKISDATNGWTTTDATADNAGLYPITFDAVVAEATDATAEQTTVTTVSTPSITTYQQGHTKATNEYSTANSHDIYVQVMNTAASPATLIGGLSATNSLVYELSDADATEAKVLDALVMRTTAVSADNVTGRNGLGLTKMTSTIDNTVTSIINGVDDNPITGLTSGTVGKIAIATLTATKSYAYVYIQQAKEHEYNQLEPVAVTVGQKINGTDASHKYYPLLTTVVRDATAVPTGGEAPSELYVYFSVTTNGTGTPTYSYISPLGKTLIPEGCKKVLKTTITEATPVTGDDNADSGTFYFDKYILNDGKYAVKVIKIVSGS